MRTDRSETVYSNMSKPAEIRMEKSHSPIRRRDESFLTLLPEAEENDFDNKSA